VVVRKDPTAEKTASGSPTTSAATSTAPTPSTSASASPTAAASATVYLLRNRYLVSVGLDRWPKRPGPTAYAGMETLVSQVLTALDEPAP